MSEAYSNLYGFFRSRFPKDGAAVFLQTPDGQTLTFDELEDATAKLAGALKGFGVVQGERVAAQIEKSPEALLLYLACQRLGAVYLPLNTAYTERELTFFLNDATPRVFVHDPTRKAPAAPQGLRTLTLDSAGQGSLMSAAWEAEPHDDLAPTRPDDLAAILYTSGTTGKPKGAMMSHANLASNAQTLHRIWGFRPGDVLLHALPIFHTHGLFVATNCALVNGGRLLFLPRFDADLVMTCIAQASVMMGVPTFYTRLLAHPGLTKDAVAHMRLFISGSAPLLEETHHAFAARTGKTILERYGMTETNMITSNPLDGERRPGTVGFALPDVDVRICGDDGKPVGDGETGMIEVKGPNVFSGYWQQPERRAEDFRPDGYFLTGDLAKRDKDGYIQIVGRDKDLIISGGFNVYPKEVELLVDALEGVLESAVIGVPHPDFGEGVIAIVVPKAGASIDEKTALASLKDTLAAFKRPKRLFQIDALPRNAMGKVQKNLLRDRFTNTFLEL